MSDPRIYVYTYTYYTYTYTHIYIYIYIDLHFVGLDGLDTSDLDSCVLSKAVT